MIWAGLTGAEVCASHEDEHTTHTRNAVTPLLRAYLDPSPHSEEPTWIVSTGRPHATARSSSMPGSWIRCAPEMISSPRMNTSYELE